MDKLLNILLIGGLGYIVGSRLAVSASDDNRNTEPTKKRFEAATSLIVHTVNEDGYAVPTKALVTPGEQFSINTISIFTMLGVGAENTGSDEFAKIGENQWVITSGLKPITKS